MSIQNFFWGGYPRQLPPPAPMYALWNYHYYCANIFWPRVIDVFRTHYGKQELKILGNLREILVSIANANEGPNLSRNVFNKVIGRKIISRHDEHNIVEILTIDFDENPMSKMIVSLFHINTI